MNNQDIVPDQQSEAQSGPSSPVTAAISLAVVPPASPGPASPATGRKPLRLALVAIVLVFDAAAGAEYWWLHRTPALPPGIAFSNGRLEADEVDVATKFAGRVSEIMVDEGAMVAAGQVVARIDTRDLQAQLSQARAQTAQARQVVVPNAADLTQMSSQLKLTAQELQRARTLVGQGYETRQVRGQRQSQFNVAAAAFRDYLAVAGLGALSFVFAMLHFRSSAAATGG